MYSLVVVFGLAFAQCLVICIFLYICTYFILFDLLVVSVNLVYLFIVFASMYECMCMNGYDRMRISMRFSLSY